MTRRIGFIAFNMKRFSKISLTIIFISVICYIPSVDAQPSQACWTQNGVIQCQTATKYAPIYDDEEYNVHLQMVIRDKNNQLVSVVESTAIYRLDTYLPNNDPIPQWISVAFDRVLMENYQSVTVDDKQYEKVEFMLVYENSISEFPSADAFLDLCMNLQVHGPTCVRSFVATMPMIFVEEENVITRQWTILREFN